jgi:hypothetical protein
MTKRFLFRIWVIGIYLRFGAWDLVLIIFAMLYALCSRLYAMFFSTNSVMSIALMGISFLRAVVKMVRTHC